MDFFEGSDFSHVVKAFCLQITHKVRLDTHITEIV